MINFCNYIEVWFKVYWPKSCSKILKSKISKLNSWSLVCFHCDPPPWRGSWDWKEQNPYIFRSRRGRNSSRKSGQVGANRVFFFALAAHVVAQIEPQYYHNKLGKVEGILNMVVLLPEVAGGRTWGAGLEFFETEQPLPTNISSVKVTKTFTDELFVGKYYS